MNDMGNVWLLGIPAIIKHVNIHAAYYTQVQCMPARLRAHIHVQSCIMSTGLFLHRPGHNCICKSVRSGQYCMADTIASDSGIQHCSVSLPHLCGKQCKLKEELIQQTWSELKIAYGVKYVSNRFKENPWFEHNDSSKTCQRKIVSLQTFS